MIMNNADAVVADLVADEVRSQGPLKSPRPQIVSSDAVPNSSESTVIVQSQQNTSLEATPGESVISTGL